jgi:hypothetical protein
VTRPCRSFEFGVALNAVKTKFILKGIDSSFVSRGGQRLIFINQSPTDDQWSTALDGKDGKNPDSKWNHRPIAGFRRRRLWIACESRLYGLY